MIVLLLLYSSLVGPAQAEPARRGLELAGVRALDEGDRTTVVLVVRNPGSQPVTLRDLAIGGLPIAGHLVPSDPRNPRSPGKGVDWFDLRPRTIPPGGAGAILLGSLTRDLREPRLALTAVTDQGDIDLSCPPPRPEFLRVASVGFAADLKTVTVMVRNDGPQAVTLRTVVFNGISVAPTIRGATAAPGMLSVLTFPCAVTFGDSCTLRILADGASATSFFRAYPAESVNYPFYGQHADRRDLAEKNMDVYVTRQEAGVHGVDEVDRNGGRMTDAMVRRLGKAAESFGKSSQSWAWYMEDDAGWGRPRPQSLIDVGRFLRERGSLQPQFLCNPADLRRYAWTHDFYMNYEYHVTGQASDPTVFGGERSLDAIRELNEPAPILYLVDAVGQSVRWITPAEEELASYAMLGRGARHLGWFLVPSVWEQGAGLGGGIDLLERRPWRYQEGATACVQVWNRIGTIAAVTKALQPHIACSARLPSHLRDDRIEVLPILCRDDLVLTTLLNRRLRCTYPRDFPEGSSSGGIQLKPHRDVSISHPLPEWIHPVRVTAFDHDRGFRDLPFEVKDQRVSVRVDALDTAVLLFISAAPAQIDALRKEVQARPASPVAGSPIRPDLAQAADSLKPRAWHDPDKNYRALLTVQGPLAEGSWIQGALPAEGVALGYFDPRSVTAFHGAGPVPSRVDYFHVVYRPSEGAEPWLLRNDDRHASVSTEPGGVRITSRWKSGYGSLQLRTPLDPDYDILELQRSIEGRFEPLLPGLSLRRPLEEDVWGQSEVLEPSGGRMALSRLRWRAMVEAKGKIPAVVRLSAQIYDGTYRFGEIRQCRSKPVVYVRNPAEVKAGESCEIQLYWSYGPAPCGETVVLSGEEKPAKAVPGVVGSVDGFRIAAADEMSMTSEARLEGAWIEGRDAQGALVFSENLRSTDGLRWTRPGKPRQAETRTLWGVGAAGRVVQVTVQSASTLPALRRFAEVPGQVESLSCSEDGRLVVAGADRVRAFDAAGKERWTFDLGDRRRQQDRFGPGRNVDRVKVVDGAGREVIAESFRWDEKARTFQDAQRVVLSAEGQELSRGGYDWKSLPALPRGPAAWPPYTSAVFPTSTGAWIAVTTQGRIRRIEADGTVRWEARRPSRIDAALLLDDGRMAIATNHYPHGWDWTFAPTVEILSLADGKVVRAARGPESDDRGHLGTTLCLAYAKGASRLYLGDCRGRLFVLDVD